jgi:gamma-glutamyl hercynylcysteine S-oxide synthase
MSLILSKEDIFKILNKKRFIKSKEQLLKYLSFTKNNFLKYSIPEINLAVSNETDKYINPLLWQVGHVVFFYANLILHNLNNCENICHIEKYHKYVEFYDSFKTPVENRDGPLLLPYTTCITYYNLIIDILINYLKTSTITNAESYLIMLGILHNEMHNEAFIFSKLSIYNIMHADFNINHIKNNSPESLETDIKFITYNTGTFVQGSSESTNTFVFDNEMPSFQKTIEKFHISKYPITEYLFLLFVKNNGYKKQEHWCNNGYKWLKNNNIEHPLYWTKEGGNYYKTINGQKMSLETNLPITNISYYEACAYCKWKNLRLPYESEYEYVATNEGQTLYPWGDENINDRNCNVNYKNYIVSVRELEEGNNFKNVSQLIGNVWEWCQEVIYPYNGFTIDPVYREMSYPFFGFKKICKGGSFVVPDFLIHPKYRNAQNPDCRIQFIGFRVCKN